MAAYTVHEPPRGADDDLAHSERFRFVRDAFAWGGFFFGPLWMLRHRLWLAFVLYAALVVALGLVQDRLGSGTITIVMLLTALLVGFEGSSLRRAKLARKGFTDAGVVLADDREAAERRFFGAFVSASKTAPVPAKPASGTDWLAAPATTGIIGSFPEPGARS